MYVIKLNKEQIKWCEDKTTPITIDTLTSMVELIYQKFTEQAYNEKHEYKTHLFFEQNLHNKNFETLSLTYNVDNNIILKVKLYYALIKKEVILTKCISPITLSDLSIKDAMITMKETILNMITTAYATMIHSIFNKRDKYYHNSNN